MKTIEEFYSKIVGSTFTDNGQGIIRTLQKDETLVLVPEPDNKFDPNAIAVYGRGERIGYLPKATAMSIIGYFKNNMKIIGEVSEVTGGTGDKTNVGCNLRVRILEDE